MKVKIIISVITAVFAILLPLITVKAKPVAEATGRPDTIISDEKEEQNAEPEDNASPEKVIESSDERTYLEDTTVDVLMDGQVVNMEIEEYLIGVVAGEMPVSFENEALKAQAVAARTYTLYKLLVSPSPNHEADVCTDSTCCKAYSGEEILREKWGDSYDTNIAKITAAVWDTQGVYMTYEGEPVLAVFHSSSAGATENSENVWNAGLPYLVSVESPENSENVSNYVSTLKIAQSEFKDIFTEKHPDADMSGDASDWITDISCSDSGRILTLKICGVEIKGTELRSIFGLRSTAATIEAQGSDIVFTVTGYGHGVGMSQYGANIMAGEGKTYREILCWYYTGVSFAVISEVF